MEVEEGPGLHAHDQTWPLGIWSGSNSALVLVDHGLLARDTCRSPHVVAMKHDQVQHASVCANTGGGLVAEKFDFHSHYLGSLVRFVKIQFGSI